jgi:hypothetical protein
VDWKAIGDEYCQKLATAQDDDAVRRQVLNPMLFEPQSFWRKIDDVVDDRFEAKN